MKRAVLISGESWTVSKRTKLSDMLRRYGDAVRFYIPPLWQGRDTKYQSFGDTRLSARLKSAAHRQARAVVLACRKSAAATGVVPSMPDVNKNTATLDAKNTRVRLEPPGDKEFDLFVDVKALHNEWLTLPCRATKRLWYWMSKPGAKLTVGAQFYVDRLILWVDVPEPDVPPGEREIGVDVGVNKLIATSDGDKFGADWRTLSSKCRRKKPGSKAKLRACRERDQYIRRSVNQLPWNEISAVAIEDLTGLKKGKKQGRGKSFRKALAPWSYRQVRQAVENKAHENGILVVPVPPRGTSRTCPNCGAENNLNRRNEEFLCQSCGHAGDADVIAAGNILTRARTLPAWSRQGLASGDSRKN